MNSTNHSQNFGRLKITATEEAKHARDLFTSSVPCYLFDEIDKISGDIPVRIHFEEDEFSFGVTREINVSCFIKDKRVAEGSEAGFDKILTRLKENLLRCKGIKNMAEKYFD